LQQICFGKVDPQEGCTRNFCTVKSQRQLLERITAELGLFGMPLNPTNPTLIDFFRHARAAIDALEKFVSEEISNSRCRLCFSAW
jgi:hypothetical protein